MARKPEVPYLRVAAALRERLNGGEWLPGEVLPSVNELGRQYEVSRATAARAIKILKDEGRVYTITGWGTFVSEQPPADS